MSPVLLYTLLVCSPLLVHCAIDDDLVTDLPGWPAGHLPTKHYSGYLTVGDKKQYHIHYYFIESEAQPTPDTPVVVWYQGGPGGSGLYGLFAEMGPFSIDTRSVTYNISQVPMLFENPNRWNKFAHLLTFETPAGVGFSYCDGTCPTWDDKSAAELDFQVMTAFFQAYSEFQPNPLYFAGQSYAGITIPGLVLQIMNNSNHLNLQGFMMGDCCVGTDTHTACGIGADYWVNEFLYHHGGYTSKVANDIEKDCGNSLWWSNFSNLPTCVADLKHRDKQVGGFNYEMWTDYCTFYSHEIWPAPPSQPAWSTPSKRNFPHVANWQDGWRFPRPVGMPSPPPSHTAVQQLIRHVSQSAKGAKGYC